MLIFICFLPFMIFISHIIQNIKKIFNICKYKYVLKNKKISFTKVFSKRLFSFQKKKNI